MRAVDEAIRPIAKIVADLALEELAAKLDPDPWVDKASSALGSQHNRICRVGKIEGAHLVGRRWLARRSAVEAFILACPAPKRVERPVVDEVDRELAGLGFGGGK